MIEIINKYVSIRVILQTIKTKYMFFISSDKTAAQNCRAHC